mmetsp:Transcript_51223/g.128529  ORF Transcript_51223/g.128529 Transcript_51223/m.128529 type:complete len:204 (+) Transcript_51223:810-1421(+)
MALLITRGAILRTQRVLPILRTLFILRPCVAAALFIAVAAAGGRGVVCEGVPIHQRFVGGARLHFCVLHTQRQRAGGVGGNGGRVHAAHARLAHPRIAMKQGQQVAGGQLDAHLLGAEERHNIILAQGRLPLHRSYDQMVEHSARLQRGLKGDIAHKPQPICCFRTKISRRSEVNQGVAIVHTRILKRYRRTKLQTCRNKHKS